MVKQRETHVYKRRHINNAKVSSNTAKQNSTGFRAKSRKRRRKLKIKMEILIKRDESVTTLFFLSALISHDFFSKMKGARFFKKSITKVSWAHFSLLLGLSRLNHRNFFQKVKLSLINDFRGVSNIYKETNTFLGFVVLVSYKIK